MYESDENILVDFEEGYDYEYDQSDFEYDEAVALQAKFDAEDLPTGAEASVTWLVEDQLSTDPTRPPVPCSSSKVPTQFQDDDSDEAIMKYKSFKSFDTVTDFSDHHYKSKSVTKSKQASQKWTRAIQQDWRLLEKDLPDTIFVRAYEERMDLLRAVIVGAAGTPYHDGLFFFDVYYPSDLDMKSRLALDEVRSLPRHTMRARHTILAACKTYIEGAQVGSIVEEEVQDVNENQKSVSEVGNTVEGAKDVNEGQKSGSSLRFRSQVGTMAGNLVPFFISNGAKNCEQFICLGDSYRLAEANYTNILKKDFYKPAEDQVVAAESQA
ncbi:hypothetical protein MKW92_025637 [Papaver armeniacum]|nr:hypothetical protein MKW92_025637 [Papaver armeniacum]